MKKLALFLCFLSQLLVAQTPVLSLDANKGFSGTTWQDQSGNNNHVQLSSNTTKTTDGIYFDGNINAMLTQSLPLSNFTIYMTLKVSEMDKTLFGNGNPSEYILHYQKNAFYTATQQPFTFFNSNSLSLNQNIVITLTRDVNKNRGNVTAYMNGNFLSNFPGSQRRVFNLTNIAGETGFLFKGWIKNICIFNTVHTATMIKNGSPCVAASNTNNVLFYNRTGQGTLTNNINFGTISQHNFSGAWTHIVNVGDNKTLFYNAASGAATLTNNSDFSTISQHSFTAGWTHIVNVGSRKILFYNSATGLNTLTNNSNFDNIAKFPFSVGWTHITNVGNNRVLFYNANTGGGTLTNNNNFSTISQHSFSNWTHITNVGDNRVVFYNANTGVGTLTNNSNFNTISQHSFSNWTHITNVGGNRVLFYNANTGVGTLTNNINFSTISQHSFSNWSLITSL